MAKIEFKGMDVYIKAMAHLEAQATPIIKQAVYEGAAIVKAAVETEIDDLPGGLSKPLSEGLLLTKMDNEEGFINTKLTFGGYYTNHTGREVPIRLLARSLNKGTRTLQKNPFMKRAVAKSRKQAEDAMQKKLDEEIEKIIK